MSSDLTKGGFAWNLGLEMVYGGKCSFVMFFGAFVRVNLMGICVSTRDLSGIDSTVNLQGHAVGGCAPSTLCVGWPALSVVEDAGLNAMVAGLL